MTKYIFGLFLSVFLLIANAHADSLDSWTMVSKSPYGGFQKIIYANGIYAGISRYTNLLTSTNGGGGISVSTDGLNWVHYKNNGVPSGFAYGTGVFTLAVWDLGTSGDAGFTFYSTNPAALTNYDTTNGFFSGLYGLTFGTNSSSQPLFVAVGHDYEDNLDTIITSVDGHFWTKRISPKTNDYLNSVAYNPGASAQFLSVGYSPYDYSTTPTATLLWSSDATTWTAYPTNQSRIPFLPTAVNCVNGTWYANDDSTNAAYAVVSSKIFTRTNIPYPSLWTPLGPARLAVGSGMYLSVNSGTNLYTASPGSSWISRNTGITNAMTCIAYGSNYFIIGCADGTLYRSGSIGTTLSVKSDPSTKLPMITAYGGLYKSGAIQVSTDLTSWTNLVTLTYPGGTNQYLDTAATNGAPRYYRAVSR